MDVWSITKGDAMKAKEILHLKQRMIDGCGFNAYIISHFFGWCEADDNIMKTPARIEILWNLVMDIMSLNNKYESLKINPIVRLHV